MPPMMAQNSAISTHADLIRYLTCFSNVSSLRRQGTSYTKNTSISIVWIPACAGTTGWKKYWIICASLLSLSEWNEMKEKSRNMMILTAKRNAVINFSVFIHLLPSEGVLRTLFAEISISEHQAHRGMLNAVVVHNNDSQNAPSPGWEWPVENRCFWESLSSLCNTCFYSFEGLFLRLESRMVAPYSHIGDH